MEMIAYTLTGIILYLLSDRILLEMERKAGRRFEYRTIYFFFILLVLALASFAIITQAFGN